MTILNITAATSGGAAAAQAECYVVLKTGGTYGGAHNGTVIGNKQRFTLANDGTYTFEEGDLAPNSEIEPEGTIYHFRVNGADYHIELPDTGEYDLADTSIWTVSTPPAIQLPGQPGPAGDQGDQGAAATIAVGDVVTLPPGDDATVTNVGTSGAAIFDFELPTGPAGATGPSPIVISEDPDEPLNPGQVLFYIDTSLWSPTELGVNLLAWYDPTLTGSADGADITTWNDQSGFGNHLVAQAITGIFTDIPYYDADGLNGFPCVVFPLVSTCADASVSWGSGPLTVMAAYQFSAATTSQQIWNGHTSGGFHTLGFGKNSGQWSYGRTTSANISSGSSNNNLSVVVAVYNGASSFVRVNGTQVLSGDPGSTAPTAFRLGLRASGSASTALQGGKIGHVVVANGAFNLTECAAAEAWLASTVGLTL